MAGLSLILFRNLTYDLEDGLAILYVPGVSHPLPPNDSITIHEKEPALCYGQLQLLAEATITFDRLEMRKVAQKWVRELEGVSEDLLGEWVVGADAKNLYVQSLEFFVVDLPGQ